MKKFVLTFAIVLGGFVYMSAQNTTETKTETKSTKSCCAKGDDSKASCSSKTETKSCCSKGTASTSKTCSSSEVKSYKNGHSEKSSGCSHGSTGTREEKKE